jgi:hypothetical protein
MSNELALNISMLLNVRLQAGFQAPSLLHLNHEQPWLNDNTNFNSRYGNTEYLKLIYSQSTMVFRQYYYEPLSIFSTYIPLGPVYYKSFLLKDTNFLSNTILNQKTIEDRSHWCFLSGRFTYDNASIHHEERMKLLHYYSTNQIQCNISSGFPHQIKYENYMRILQDTVFAPCPAGNNFETFRQYEALEAGAIPVFQRNSSSNNYDEQDFLSLWIQLDYPGPIIKDWLDLNDLYRLLKDDRLKVSVIQRDIIEWYEKYKSLIKLKIQNDLIRSKFISNNCSN